MIFGPDLRAKMMKILFFSQNWQVELRQVCDDMKKKLKKYFSKKTFWIRNLPKFEVLTPPELRERSENVRQAKTVRNSQNRPELQMATLQQPYTLL